MRHKKDKTTHKTVQNHKKESRNSKTCNKTSLSKRIKAIQLITVVILLIAAFYLGKISMTEQIRELNGRIKQMEVQIDQIQRDKIRIIRK